KDVDSLNHKAKALGEDTLILDAVTRVNAERTPRFIARIMETMEEVKGKHVAVLGLAFKPNTDDMREAKSIEVIKALHAEGAEIVVYDPISMPRAMEEDLLPAGVRYADSAYDCAEGADVLIIMTEWNEFKLLN